MCSIATSQSVKKQTEVYIVLQARKFPLTSTGQRHALYQLYRIGFMHVYLNHTEKVNDAMNI